MMEWSKGKSYGKRVLILPYNKFRIIRLYKTEHENIILGWSNF